MRAWEGKESDSGALCPHKLCKNMNSRFIYGLTRTGYDSREIWISQGFDSFVDCHAREQGESVSCNRCSRVEGIDSFTANPHKQLNVWRQEDKNVSITDFRKAYI